MGNKLNQRTMQEIGRPEEIIQKENVIRLFRKPVPKQKIGIIKFQMIREGLSLYGSAALTPRGRRQR